MNKLENIELENATITFGSSNNQFLNGPTVSGIVWITDDCVFQYREKAISVSDFFQKMELLDKIIKEVLPEEIIK